MSIPVRMESLVGTGRSCSSQVMESTSHLLPGLFAYLERRARQQGYAPPLRSGMLSNMSQKEHLRRPAHDSRFEAPTAD